MFIGYYELDGKEFYNIYYKNNLGFKEWHKGTFSPTTENIKILDFTIKGKNYREKKYYLEDLAKDWQINFSYLSWSYGELAEIENYFYKNAKRYGLLKVFKENCIC